MERYEAYKDSGVEWIGEIPVSWDMLRIQQCFAEERRINNQLESFHALKFSAGTIVPKPEAWDEEEVSDTYARYRCVSPGTIMINNLNLNFDLKSLRVGLVEEEGIITSAYVAIVPCADMESRFANYVLKSWDYRKAFHNMGKGLRLTLDWFELSKYRIQVPSIREQQAIADYLDARTAEIDGLVADCEREVGLLQEYRKAVISEAVTKGLDPDASMKDSGVEWIGEIPEGWRVKRLKFLLRVSLQYGATESGIPFDESLPRYIRITDIDSLGKLKEDDKKSLSPDLAAPYMLADEDILFARSGATVGKAFLYRADMGDAAFAGYLIKAACKREVLLPSYLSYWTQSVLYDFWKESVFNQATIQNIGADKYKELPIVVPNTRIQFEIKSYLEAKAAEIDSLIEAKQSMADKLREYRKSLISEAVTGKFKVPGI